MKGKGVYRVPSLGCKSASQQAGVQLSTGLAPPHPPQPQDTLFLVTRPLSVLGTLRGPSPAERRGGWA